MPRKGGVPQNLKDTRAGDEPMAEKPLTVRVPVDVDAAVRALDKPSDWLRRVITEAARKELIKSGDQPATENETLKGVD